MASEQLVKNKVSKYHLEADDLKAHLKTLFPGARIKVVDPVSCFFRYSFVLAISSKF